MTPLDRASSLLASARRRHPLAVMPGHVLSPMDSHQTISIGRELIQACDPGRHQLPDTAPALSP